MLAKLALGLSIYKRVNECLKKLIEWQLVLFGFIFYAPVNNFSVMLGHVFLGWTSVKQRIKCFAQGHNTANQSAVRLEPAAIWSPV